MKKKDLNNILLALGLFLVIGSSLLLSYDTVYIFI